MSMPEEYLTRIVSETAAEHNLQNWQYSLKSFKNVAQNYFGVLIPLILSGKSGGQTVSKALVLKLAPTDERFRVSGAITLFFAREIFVYSKLLKRYNEIQANIQMTRYVIPECHYTCPDYCNEAIVMQDMCEEGYQPATESMFLNYEHILISLKSLAKFHALSFILREKDKDFFKEVSETCIPLNEKTNRRFMDILLNRLENALRVFEGSIYIPLLNKLRENCTGFVSKNYDTVNEVCVCHGDIWKENIMFKYVDDKPVEVCIIDYQTARMSSPAYDALFLITSSTDGLLRNEFYYQMLDAYHQSLTEALTAASLDAKSIYSRRKFDQDLKTVAPACFIIANTSLWLSSGLQQEGHVRSKITINSQEELDIATNKYKEIIAGVIDDYVKYNYLEL